MKKLSVFLLLIVFSCFTAAAGELGDQLRALATKVDVAEAKTCSVCPTVPTTPDPVPPIVTPPSSTLKPLAADAITGSVAKPALGTSYVDPVYGTTIYRASEGARQDYSRRQAFNADNSRYLQVAPDGYWYLHDGRTYARLKRLNFLAGDSEAIWHPSNPKLLLHTAREGVGGVWSWLDVEANTRTQAFSLAGKAPFSSAKSFWTKAEGTTSADGRYLALMAETYNSNGSVTFYGVVTVDVTTGTVVGSLATSNRPDHVSMSPSGKYAVVSWTGSNGTRAYTRDFASFRQLHTTSEHSDLAFGPNREDLFVYTDYTAGQIVAKNLDTGASFNLTALYPASGSSYAAHISGQAFGKPGVVAISTYADYANYGSTRPDPKLQPQYRKVFLAELKPGGRLLSVAHIRGTGTGYFDEPQATISRDGTRIMWASNLGAGTSDSFVAVLPTGAIP